MKFIINLIVSGLCVALAAYLIPSVQVDGFVTAIIVSVVLALVNATVGFVLRLITLPFNILTLGLVSLIISVIVVMLTDGLLDGFSTGGFWSAARFAIILCIVQMLLGYNQEDK